MFFFHSHDFLLWIFIYISLQIYLLLIFSWFKLWYIDDIYVILKRSSFIFCFVNFLFYYLFYIFGFKIVFKTFLRFFGTENNYFFRRTLFRIFSYWLFLCWTKYSKWFLRAQCKLFLVICVMALLLFFAIGSLAFAIITCIWYRIAFP